MRVGDKRFRTRPFSKLHTLIYSVRWVKNRFRQTADPRSQGPELKSSFSSPWIPELSAVVRCFYKLCDLLLLLMKSTVENALFYKMLGFASVRPLGIAFTPRRLFCCAQKRLFCFQLSLLEAWEHRLHLVSQAPFRFQTHWDFTDSKVLDL